MFFKGSTAAVRQVPGSKRGSISGYFGSGLGYLLCRGTRGYGCQAAYCASKGALIPLTKSLALAWAADGINVTVVLPGAANTPVTKRILDTPEKLAYMKERIPLGRLAEAEDLVGTRGYGCQAAYCASKGALIPLAKSLAMAWAADGINVNVVLPAAAYTPFTKRFLDTPEKLAYMKEHIPLGRLAEAEDLVGPIVSFASRAADYCTGSTLVEDGGTTSRARAQ